MKSPRSLSQGMQVVLIVLALLMLWVLISAPLVLEQQLVFFAACFIASLLLRRRVNRLAILAMVALSVIASCRYMYWRLTESLGFENVLDQVFGYGLVAAELYAFVVLLLGYVQTAWPLNRRPQAMPQDVRVWPSVDVYIPTYNEPLDIVKLTAFAAMAIDWPRDKLNVYVLDDGRRDSFQAFCQEAGIGYIRRENNLHAKAGNLNNALGQTRGEYIAIFDADHVPTRSFLQVVMGWFLKDPKLAMLQTPHHFFSPDPFERNLNTFRTVPGEGELFYGVVQDGNDLWNAAFFCGSCAVLKRVPLEEVGGVAVETVTEDAHTALKMSRLGYNTAYLAIPQAAGLATERLSGHIGQRIRWARGMAQIFRIDNPLFSAGLNLGQRLCYFNAMLHFFYGLPRLVFLTAPLAYLLLGAHIFHASALMILAYGLPHILQASLTNSSIQGRFRYSFWNEVYETVLAWHITRPVLLALISPRSGAFNVTAKGGVVSDSYFDWEMAMPYIVIFSLNLLGMVVGVTKLFGEIDSSILATLLINLTWTLYNLIICSAALAVASEARQVREQPRVHTDLPAKLLLADGQLLECVTKDFSQSGLGLSVPPGVLLEHGARVQVTLVREQEQVIFPALVVFSEPGLLGLELIELSVQQQYDLTRMTFSRADMWADGWGNTRDKPLTALAGVIQIGAHGVTQLCKSAVLELSRAVKRSE